MPLGGIDSLSLVLQFSIRLSRIQHCEADSSITPWLLSTTYVDHCGNGLNVKLLYSYKNFDSNTSKDLVKDQNILEHFNTVKTQIKEMHQKIWHQ